MNRIRRLRGRSLLLTAQFVCVLLMLGTTAVVVRTVLGGSPQDTLIALLIILIGLALVLIELRQQLRRQDRRKNGLSAQARTNGIGAGHTSPRQVRPPAASGSLRRSASSSFSQSASIPGSDAAPPLATSVLTFSEAAPHGHHVHADHAQACSLPGDMGASSPDTGSCSPDTGGQVDSGGGGGSGEW